MEASLQIIIYIPLGKPPKLFVAPLLTDGYHMNYQ